MDALPSGPLTETAALPSGLLTEMDVLHSGPLTKTDALRSGQPNAKVDLRCSPPTETDVLRSGQPTEMDALRFAIQEAMARLAAGLPHQVETATAISRGLPSGHHLQAHVTDRVIRETATTGVTGPRSKDNVPTLVRPDPPNTVHE